MEMVSLRAIARVGVPLANTIVGLAASVVRSVFCGPVARYRTAGLMALFARFTTSPELLALENGAVDPAGRAHSTTSCWGMGLLTEDAVKSGGPEPKGATLPKASNNVPGAAPLSSTAPVLTA